MYYSKNLNQNQVFDYTEVQKWPILFKSNHRILTI